MTPAQLVTLKTELTNDPTGRGYAPFVASGACGRVADLVNTPVAGQTAKRLDVAPAEIVAAIDVADIVSFGANPTAAQLSTERRMLAWLGTLPAMGSVRLQNDDASLTPVGKNLDAMFPSAGATATRARILALMTAPASRAFTLFGAGTMVTPADVQAALLS